jgi:DNA-binding winged helix-turn-helix (wHTH) protein
MRLTFDDYILDVARRELWRGCEPVVVEPQVFDLLAYLVQHLERVVTKDELLRAVWDGRIVSESAITNRFNAARRAIGDSGEKQRLIRTVPRKGFRFIGAIKKEAVESDKGGSAAGFPSPPGNRSCLHRRCIGFAGRRHRRVFAVAGPSTGIDGRHALRAETDNGVGRRSAPAL